MLKISGIFVKKSMSTPSIILLVATAIFSLVMLIRRRKAPIPRTFEELEKRNQFDRWYYKRDTQYYETLKERLKEMRDNGMITEEAYHKSMKANRFEE